MDATNNIFASTAHQTLFFTQKKAGMISTPPFRPTTESIFRLALYPWPHTENTSFCNLPSWKTLFTNEKKSLQGFLQAALHFTTLTMFQVSAP